MLKLCKNIKKLQFPTFESITHCFNAGVIAPLQPTKVILFTMTAQFGNHHSRYKTILSSIVLSQECYELYFISQYWTRIEIWLLNITEIDPLTLLTGSSMLFLYVKVERSQYCKAKSLWIFYNCFVRTKWVPRFIPTPKLLFWENINQERFGASRILWYTDVVHGRPQKFFQKGAKRTFCLRFSGCWCWPSGSQPARGTGRAGLKGRGARGNFYWRAPMT